MQTTEHLDTPEAALYRQGVRDGIISGKNMVNVAKPSPLIFFGGFALGIIFAIVFL